MPGAPTAPAVKHLSLTTLRDKLIKIGAKVVCHARHVTFQTAEKAVPRRLFENILRRISRLRPVPGWRNRVLPTRPSANHESPRHICAWTFRIRHSVGSRTRPRQGIAILGEPKYNTHRSKAGLQSWQVVSGCLFRRRTSAPYGKSRMKSCQNRFAIGSAFFS